MIDALSMSGYQEYISTFGDEDYDQSTEMDCREYGDHNDNNVQYAFINDRGELTRIDYGICFGRFNDFNGWFEDESIHSILVQINTTSLEYCDTNWGMLTAYYNWLFNHSPMKSAYMSSVEEVLENKVVVVSAHVENGLLGNALSALRLPWESFYIEHKLPSIVHLWYMVTQRYPNLDPTVVFAFCNSMKNDSGSWCVRGSTAGHQFLRVISFTSLLNFTNNDWDNTDVFSSCREIGGITSIWEEGRSESDINMLDWMKERLVGNEKKINIFAPNNHSILLNDQQAIEAIARCVNDFQQERDV